jgi:hypothetical protein
MPITKLITEILTTKRGTHNLLVKTTGDSNNLAPAIAAAAALKRAAVKVRVAKALISAHNKIVDSNGINMNTPDVAAAKAIIAACKKIEDDVRRAGEVVPDISSDASSSVLPDIHDEAAAKPKKPICMTADASACIIPDTHAADHVDHVSLGSYYSQEQDEILQVKANVALLELGLLSSRRAFSNMSKFEIDYCNKQELKWQQDLIDCIKDPMRPEHVKDAYREAHARSVKNLEELEQFKPKSLFCYVRNLCKL